MSHEPSSDPVKENQSRSAFLRDVLMLQWKLFVGNVHNFVLVPLSLAAALMDLVSMSGEHGSRFYRVLAWGRQAEEAIGLYSALDRRAEDEANMRPDATFKAVALPPNGAPNSTLNGTAAGSPD